MAVNILRLRQGYLSLGPFLPGGPEQFFQDVSQTTFVIKSCLYNAQTLILDGVVVSASMGYCLICVCSQARADLANICGLAELLRDHRSRARLAGFIRYAVYTLAFRSSRLNRPIAAIIGTNVTLATASTHSRDIFFVETGRWITANYSATLATNLSATGVSRMLQLCTV